MKLRFMDFRKSKACRRQIKRLYTEAFPLNERIPYFLLKHLARKNVDFYGIYDEQEFVGMIYNVHYKDIVYIFFYAVSEAFRGQGYGSRILQVMKKKYAGDTLILCIEALDEPCSNYEERVKRKAFYNKNGFYDLDYRIREAGVVYQMLCCQNDGKTIEELQFQALMKSYFGKFVYRFVYKAIVQR